MAGTRRSKPTKECPICSEPVGRGKREPHIAERHPNFAEAYERIYYEGSERSASSVRCKLCWKTKGSLEKMVKHLETEHEITDSAKPSPRKPVEPAPVIEEDIIRSIDHLIAKGEDPAWWLFNSMLAWADRAKTMIQSLVAEVNQEREKSAELSKQLEEATKKKSYNRKSTKERMSL